MQTNFSPEQLRDPAIVRSEAILRKCVHCGFCTATCPTYLTLGDELDSPRGRIYLIKEMLENGRPADERTVRHIDRCLSCLACMTTCPSGVDYMHLVDHARAHIEETYRRPLLDRLIRATLAAIVPYPGRFRAALRLARLAKPFRGLIARAPAGERLAAMLALAPPRLPPRQESSGTVFPATIHRRARVALLTGCAQSVLAPSINKAAIDLLNRQGVEVVLARDEGCCGALVHHMGREEQALAQASRNIDAWHEEIDGEGLDAILITASGCGVTIKDYGQMFLRDPRYAAKAARISALAQDITEYLEKLDPHPVATGRGIRLAYHSACSLQHGQRISRQPRELLRRAGFNVVEIPEGHICCGSAGTYNMLQPEISARLLQRKIANIGKIEPHLIAAGNIGCITQIASASSVPVVHTVELLNWAYGGARPAQVEPGLGRMVEVD